MGGEGRVASGERRGAREPSVEFRHTHSLALVALHESERNFIQEVNVGLNYADVNQLVPATGSVLKRRGRGDAQ